MILSEAVMDELFSIESEYDREVTYQKLLVVAERYRVKGNLVKLYRARARDEKRKLPADKQEPKCNETMFSFQKDAQPLLCGSWIADDSGIRILTEKGMTYACRHPIYPTRILKNAETGQYKVELEFYVRGKIRRALVDRSIVASEKIVKLADESVMVTSATAKMLCQYLADVEALNPDLITEVASTSRLGWIEDISQDGQRTKKFLPYDSDVVYDNELNTKALFDSIRSCGSRDKWFKLVKEIRAKNQTEVLINLAASFASVLVEPCNALPFIVSLWGGTGIGKTVVLMLATSIWADPSEGQYMTDAKATSTAMEIRLNILNSLPMTLDDMAQVKNQYDEDFSALIYRWCAGKGKDRSNQTLGLNKLTSWRNCTLTNGERSLVDESTQGGAVNRVIDVESDGKPLFEGDFGNKVATILRSNFGFAGRDFVNIIEGLGNNELESIKNKYFDEIKRVAKEAGCEKEDKQVIPMALILAADEITEQYIFKDGVRLDIAKCVSYLKNKGEVSEHKRAYEYIHGWAVSNSFHFAKAKDGEFDSNIEQWGYWEIAPDLITKTGVVVFSTVFEKMMQQAGFQSRAFLSWAERSGLIETEQDGHRKKTIRVNGTKTRCVVLKFVDTEETEEESGFVAASDEELPFD